MADIGNSNRISREYLGTMRRKEQNSPVVQYPYVNTEGFYGYEKALAGEMTDWLVSKIHKIVPDSEIFLWK